MLVLSVQGCQTCQDTAEDPVSCARVRKSMRDTVARLLHGSSSGQAYERHLRGASPVYKLLALMVPLKIPLLACSRFGRTLPYKVAAGVLIPGAVELRGRATSWSSHRTEEDGQLLDAQNRCNLPRRGQELTRFKMSSALAAGLCKSRFRPSPPMPTRMQAFWTSRPRDRNKCVRMFTPCCNG